VRVVDGRLRVAYFVLALSSSTRGRGTAGFFFGRPRDIKGRQRRPRLARLRPERREPCLLLFSLPSRGIVASSSLALGPPALGRLSAAGDLERLGGRRELRPEQQKVDVSLLVHFLFGSFVFGDAPSAYITVIFESP
jgi:hypothetical protein